MKKNRDFRTSDLTVDFVEYLFIEWLCRRRVFSAFRSNYGLTKEANVSFRESLRCQIRCTFLTPYLGISDLVNGSFIFDCTPEGRDFWSAVSSDWRRFCINLRREF